MRAKKSCRRVLQATFAILNIAFFAIGVMVLSVGVYLILTDNGLALVTGSRNISGAVILILSGGITAIVAILGVCGSLVVKKWILILYVILMSIVFVAEISLGIVGFVFQNILSDHVANSVESAINGYQPQNTTIGGDSKDNEIIDLFQEGFSCCGYNGPQDWLNTEFMNTSSLVVPRSCHCDPGIYPDDCNATLTNYPQLYVWDKGCSTALLDIIKDYSITLGVVAILFAVFQILAIIQAICIACCIKKKDADLVAPK